MDSFRVGDHSGVDAIFVNTSAFPLFSGRAQAQSGFDGRKANAMRFL
jgi:hypothetical protein